MPDDVVITLNGSEKVLSGMGEAPTVDSLVASLGLRADRVALERNGEIVSRAEWPATAIVNGDRVELVHFVGGGI